ncbi:hypothetical protein NHX12_030956 [Muraenolepis orangiensis]|uniref:Zinc finger piccolo-type domain-containing protein n=1 Tax=Muraenolepis orangiensis TaxID=630683 RepID=A0A9Q0ECT1_9TELE|nr:hypothetical protein NHX12_030956 [Muraenolepis orangiensis]
MGNEASLEGEGEAGGQAVGSSSVVVPAAGAPPTSIPAPLDSGQLIKPSNGAPAGGTGAPGPGPGPVNRPPQTDPGPKAGVQSGPGTGDRLASHESHQPVGPQGGEQQGKVPASRMSLQVEAGSRSGRSPVSAAPDGGSAPSSPYSVPQIAPLPSSKLCPVCNTADLMGSTDGEPNHNTCTQCRSMVCNQCGFNPNPHLTQVQEWLCLNCQMQRALGMDMTTPRSKSQQQIHSPSQPAKPQLTSVAPAQPAPQSTQAQAQSTQAQAQPTQAQAQPTQAQTKTQTPSQPQQAPQAQQTLGPQRQPGPGVPGQQQQQQQQQHPKLPPGAVPLPGLAKAPSQPDLSRNPPAHLSHIPRQDQTRSAGSSPSRQPPPPEQTFGKLFGFGASLLNQASTLISETAQPPQQPPKPAPKPTGPQAPGPGAGKPPGPPLAQQGPHAPPKQQQQQQQQQQHQQHQQQQQQQPQQQHQQQQQQRLPQQQAHHDPPSEPKASCPLCKTSLNVGHTGQQPNYNTCTQCHSQVCNMCGFNPTPHLVENSQIQNGGRGMFLAKREDLVSLYRCARKNP